VDALFYFGGEKTMKKTKLFLLLIMLFVTVTIGAVCASAETFSGECSDNLTWSLDASTGVLEIDGTGAMWGGFLWNLTDNSCTAPWYDYKSVIKSVVVENGVTSISGNAFRGCTRLESAIICDSVISIGSGAFAECDSLVSITIPDSVVSIESSTFANCISLTSVSIPDSVTSIVSDAFDGCHEDLTIYGYYGSYAETFAENEGISFIGPALPGDLNCDGEVDLLDLIILARHIANWTGYETIPLV
jgi:hypothetical protein